MGVVVEAPACGQRTVDLEEVPLAGRVASADDLFRHGMAALPDALLYALDGHIGGRQPEEEQAKFIAGCRQRFNPWSECAAGERRLERHIGPLRGEMAQALPALILPASKATLSGRKEERPLAMMSAFTNSCTAKAPARTSAAAVVLPAPLGPATTTRLGPGVDISWDACPS